jgi:hypothetical protein
MARSQKSVTSAPGSEIAPMPPRINPALPSFTLRRRVIAASAMSTGTNIDLVGLKVAVMVILFVGAGYSGSSW